MWGPGGAPQIFRRGSTNNNASGSPTGTQADIERVRYTGNVTLGDYLASPESFPDVDRTAARAAAPPRLPTPRGMVRRPGQAVGTPLPFNPPMGPGAVGGGAHSAPMPQASQRPTLADPAHFERMRSMTSRWGADAGRLAAQSRFQPRYRRPQQGEAPPSSLMGPGGVTGSPVARASAETGVSENYLGSLIEHESNGDDEAKAPTSSATGPAQFIDSTWLRMMRQHGPTYGLPEEASDRDILALRTNRNWAALMAGEYAHENSEAMTQALRRPITEGEAYLGHFLGADDAADLIAAADGNMSDARRFVSRDAVEANRNVFYRPDGRPRTAREVVQLQSRRFSGQPLGERR